MAALLALWLIHAGMSQRRQSEQVERLLAEFSRQRAAHEEEERRRWEDYQSLANQSRARIEEMAKTIWQLRRREEEIQQGIASVALQRSREESRIAADDIGEFAGTVQESLGLSARPVEQDGGLFFPLPLSRELAIAAIGCRADHSELSLRREECQNLRDQLSARESDHAELQSMVKTAEAALESEKAARQREVEECQSVVKSVAKAARKGFWGKVWDRTKIVLAFAAGAVVGRVAH